MNRPSGPRRRVMWEEAQALADLVERDRSWAIRNLISFAYDYVTIEGGKPEPGAPIGRTKKALDMLEFLGLR